MIISPFLGILKNWLILAAIIPGYWWYDHPEIRSNKGIQYNPPCDRGTCVAIFRSVNVFLAGIRPWPSLCANGVHAGRLYIYNIYIYHIIYISYIIYIYISHCANIYDIATDNIPFMDDLPIEHGDFPQLCYVDSGVRWVRWVCWVTRCTRCVQSLIGAAMLNYYRDL